MIAWIEKQGQHANYRNKIQIGDKVTRNDNGELINLSQLKRVAKKDENQGEQNLDNSAKTCKDAQETPDKVEPKFKVGDWVIDKQGIVHQIANVIENVTYHTYGYDIVGGGYFNENTEGIRLWTIQDAKDAGKRTFFGELVHSPISKGVNSAYGIGFIEGMVEYRDLLNRVWHDANEEPEIDKTFLLIAPNGNSSLCLRNGKELISHTLGGGHSVLCKGDKWAYVSDLLHIATINFNVQEEV